MADEAKPERALGWIKIALWWITIRNYMRVLLVPLLVMRALEVIKIPQTVAGVSGALTGMIGGSVCPTALAILGYFSIFKGLDWIYLVIVVTLYAVCVIIGVLSFSKDQRYVMYCEILIIGFSWVWLLATIPSIWFAVSALFLDGSWWEFGYSFLVAGLFRMWTRDSMWAQRFLGD